MPLIKPKPVFEKQQLRVRLPAPLVNEIEAYCAWSGIKQVNAFIEEAAQYILSKDKEWRAYQQKQSEQGIVTHN